MKKILIIAIAFFSLFATAFKKSSEINSVGFEKDIACSIDNTGLANDAKSAVLLEPTTLEVIFEKNPYLELEPASMTKIMTMILVMEAINNNIINYDQKLTTSEYATKMGGTQIYLEVGEQMSVNDLLKSLAIASANDAAIVLAEGISGSTENFVKSMNEKAKEIGLTHTVFKNPNGLPEKGHYSCAMDMALMSAYLINNYGNDILRYTSVYEDYVREDTKKKFWLVNRNKLVKFVDGVDGLKTGWTTEAGYCLTATMKKDDFRLIAVVMGNSTPENRTKEALQMLNYGMSNYEVASLFKEGDIIETYQDVNLIPTTYHIIVTESVNILKKKGENLKEIKNEATINYENIDGIKNKDIGKLKIYYDNKLYKEIDLDLLENVKKASFFDIFLGILREVFLVAK